MNTQKAGELQDVQAIISKHGFPINDFKFVEDNRPLFSGPYVVLQGILTVTRTSSGQAAQYAFGHGREWVTKFEQDLRHHAFGEP